MHFSKLIGIALGALILLAITVSARDLFGSVGGGGGGTIAYALTELYPEDLSFRSGLAYEVQTWGEVEGAGGTKQQKMIQTTRNYWNSRYPFMDPTSSANTYKIQDFVPINVGFRAKILRYPNDGSAIGSGRVSYTLAVIPYLAASETTTYDKTAGLNRISRGQITQVIDKYGNEKAVQDLGYIGKFGYGSGGTYQSAFSKTFADYKVKNPYYLDGSNALTRNSQYLNLQPSTPITFTDSKLSDNRISEINYVYETNPLLSTSISSINSESAAKSLLGFYGLFVPEKTLVKDYYGRILGQQKMDLQVLKSGFDSCTGVQLHADNEGCFEVSCDSKLGPFDNTQNCIDTSSPTATYCIRSVASKITSSNAPNSGYYARAFGSKENVISQILTTKFDQCGNPVELKIEAKYKHPFLNPSPDANGDEVLLSASSIVKSTYSGNKVSPNSVTRVATSNPVAASAPDIATSATYLQDNVIETTTNERGVVAKYEYDAIGRISKVILPGDSQTEPSMQYSYGEVEDTFGFGGMVSRIFEKRKISSGKYVQSYYFYDGMGRFVQSQTYDDARTASTSDDAIILSLKSYDALGRVEFETKPAKVAVSASDGVEFGNYLIEPIISNGNAIALKKRSYLYDYNGQVLKVTDFDGKTTTSDYAIMPTGESSKVTTTDAKNNVRTYYSDSRGNLLKVELPTP
ncbi:hypothetical protein HY989_04040 [Candidatus Micrarchaeota archaeon]|nr:hypothetical protein [Candidatus Micrarchaeota archaeon]